MGKTKKNIMKIQQKGAEAPVFFFLGDTHREQGGFLEPPCRRSHTHTHQGRVREAPVGPPATSRRRPTIPHLGCRLHPSHREREAAKAGASWVKGCGTSTPVAVATSTVLHAGRRRWDGEQRQ